MKVYKIAQSEHKIEKVSEIIKLIYEIIGEGIFSDGKRSNTAHSFEITDEVDVRGTNYIQIYYSSSDDSIGVSKYYEYELADEEYGDNKKIPINFDNPQLTIDAVIEVIKRLKND